jgi:hypothetical protein
VDIAGRLDGKGGIMIDNSSGLNQMQPNLGEMLYRLINHLPELSGAELKVILYVLHHARMEPEAGSSMRISTEEFMKGRRDRSGARMDRGTGLSNKAVIRALKDAFEHGYLTVQVDAREGRRIHKYYGLGNSPWSGLW